MLALLAALSLLTSVLLGLAAHGTAAGPLFIHDITLISPERATPLAHADVLVRDGRIAQIGVGLSAPPDARQIDGRGRFLIPGLIDSHVHVGHSGALDDDAIDAHPELWAAYKAHVPKAYLAFGFTTLVDLDDSAATLKWFEALPLRPRFYHCGRGVKVAGGYGAQRVPALTAPNFPNLVYEPAAQKEWPAGLNARDFTPAHAVDEVVKAGGICVKAFVETGFGLFNWPVPSVATLQALQQNAHGHGLKFIVHANSVDAWRSALDAHADIIAHGLWYWGGELKDTTVPASAQDIIARAAREGTHVQPTLQVLLGEHAIIDWSILDDPRMAMALPRSVVAYLKSDPGQAGLRNLFDGYNKGAGPLGIKALLAAATARVEATFRLMLKAKVPLLFGSDTPAGDGVGNPPGLNGRLELQDWADAGAPLDLILRAATIDNAIAIGQARDLGSIEVGKRADLLLLKANPLESVSAYDSIETIVLDGAPLARASLMPSE